MNVILSHRQLWRLAIRNYSNELRVPGIVVDINGVIQEDNCPIPNATKAVKMLKGPLSKLSLKYQGVNTGIPVVFMTNMGGCIEGMKAQELNSILSLNDKEVRIEADDIILSHTPIKELAKDYKDEYVIISGIGNILEVALNYGFNKAITIDEYSVLFPYIVWQAEEPQKVPQVSFRIYIQLIKSDMIGL